MWPIVVFQICDLAIVFKMHAPLFNNFQSYGLSPVVGKKLGCFIKLLLKFSNPDFSNLKNFIQKLQFEKICYDDNKEFQFMFDHSHGRN